ncbi:ChbG/HpnK family deacetylase [Cyanobium sp. WAJ14-Wanaka]|uniref:ChbG/HpnK family deacetylase n=1 Tax=Cyanobium sp. WAJ14-Wanaka TaxID=2823725 RepID=UPI0020CE7AD4|nr:ChbG/HpnK family deacetylase [Cyanobium sp. WAJ14-Wanaka]MCP9774730.1 ChbG/HpnK family deacetylase [Cyanobium sp. WAJ14-Wanaka]
MFADLGKYGLVGVLAALLHAFILLALSGLGFYLLLANLLALLSASIWSFVAHSRFSFKKQTGGRLFPRPWLALQLIVNVVLSLLLPIALGAFARSLTATVLLVLTPTVVNYLVWNSAARHTARLHSSPEPDFVLPVRFHADDLGLAKFVNEAIFELFDRHQLDSASLMVSAPALEHALAGWRRRPQMELALHLVLTEGPPTAPVHLIPDLVDGKGNLRLGFGFLLMASVLPLSRSRRLFQQIGIEIQAQISKYKQLTGKTSFSLDGHQHVHLLPIVWRQLLRLPPSMRPTWIRTINEPWPPGLAYRFWLSALGHGGVVKSLVLKYLNSVITPVLAYEQISTNGSFSGVLFTGRMAGAPLAACLIKLRQVSVSSASTPSLLLVHPAFIDVDRPSNLEVIDPSYHLSRRFYASPWRQREFESLACLIRK